MYVSVGNFGESFATVAEAAVAVITDPHAKEAMCLVERLVPPDEKKPSFKQQVTDVMRLASDPHLTESACRLLQLKALEQGKPMPECKQVPVSHRPGEGIGLRYAIVPLRSLVAARERPILAAAVWLTGVGLLVGAGYALGRRRRG